ncbi:hypothetical protein ACOMHN_038201 [Nucella lapillus]
MNVKVTTTRVNVKVTLFEIGRGWTSKSRRQRVNVKFTLLNRKRMDVNVMTPRVNVSVTLLHYNKGER